MKPWTAISLLNKAGLPPKKRAGYLKKAIKRLGLKLTREQLLAANLSPVDTALLARRERMKLTVSDIFRHANRGVTTDEFVNIARFIKPTFEDINVVFKTVYDKTVAMQKLNMKVTVAEVTTPERIGYELPSYAPFLVTRPTRAEIAAFAHSLPETYAKTCTSFGYDVTFQEIMAMFNPFTAASTVYDKLARLGIPIPTEYMLNNWFPVQTLVRQMWARACPVVYNLDIREKWKADVGHAGMAGTGLVLFRAKRAVRVIQRFARFIVRTRAAKTIQRAFRKCSSDPAFALARNRLRREFFAIAASG